MTDRIGKSRRRWARRLAWAAAALAVALALALFVVPLLVPERVLGRVLARRIANSLGRGTRVAGARISVFSGLWARGITIRRRPGFGEGDLARIGSLHVRIGWASLLGGTRRLTELRVEDADICLVRDASGTLNIQDLLERPPSGVRLGHFAASGVRLSLDGQGVELAKIDLGAPLGGRRSLAIEAKPSFGGQASLTGEVWTEPRSEEFSHAHLKLDARSLGVGRLAGAGLSDALLDAALDLEVRAERVVRADGELKLRGLPAVPQMGFDGPDRAVVLSLKGEWSPFNPHAELAIAALPGEGFGLTASLKRVVADGSVPAFLMDNYLLDVQAKAHADFSRGGLPGTRLAAGRATLAASLHGTIADTRARVRASLEGGAVKLADGASSPLGYVGLDAVVDASAKDLAAELTLFLVEAPGLSVTAGGSVRPASVQAASSGSLPPMKGKATYTVDLALARWTPALRVLLGLPAERPAEGTVAARGSAELDGSRLRHSLRVEVDRVPLDRDIELVGRLPVLNVVEAIVGGRPDQMDFVTTLKGDFTSEGWTGMRLMATLAGKGDLHLDRLRFAGSPLLRLLANLTRHPELRELTFAQADAPFTVANGSVRATATLPYEEGSLVFRGESMLAGPIAYTLHVGNPSGIRFIPASLVAYLAADQPLMAIAGTVDTPLCRIPTEKILLFNIEHKLQDSLGNPPREKE